MNWQKAASAGSGRIISHQESPHAALIAMLLSELLLLLPAYAELIHRYLIKQLQPTSDANAGCIAVLQIPENSPTAATAIAATSAHNSYLQWYQEVSMHLMQQFKQTIAGLLLAFCC